VWQTLTVTVAVPTTATGVFPAIYFSASCGVYIDSAMLVVGSQPANYVPLHPADDLARCLRYYEGLAGNDAVATFSGYQGAGGAFYTMIPFRVIKAVVPTVTKNGTWTVSNASQPIVGANNSFQMRLDVTVTTAGFGFVQPVGAPSPSLVAEANP
jgi:hypothetical protein